MMNKKLKQNIIFYIIYLIIAIILALIPIICFVCFGILTHIDEYTSSKNNVSHIVLDILEICFCVLFIFAPLYLLLRNFLLIFLWMFMKKFHPQSRLMQFFNTLQSDNSKQIIVLIISLLLDVIRIFIVKSFLNFPLWPDSVLVYFEFNSGGLITNFVIFILVLKIDGWIKNRKVAKKS